MLTTVGREGRATPYDDEFFQDVTATARTSAQAIVPHVMELIRPTTVVDFGCGQGVWLRTFKEHGVKVVLGLDGSYVDRNRLLVDPHEFRPADLQQPIHLDQKFDLALCLEVAEHLPARSAGTLVQSLVAAAPIVLFSAALPGQGGTAHLNERWPQYWETLFEALGMRKHDVLRPRLWHDGSIATWYRQNIYLYARRDIRLFDDLPRLEPEFTLISNRVLDRVTVWRSQPITRTLLTLEAMRGWLRRRLSGPRKRVS
jgi:SAM-dependent methyltransferase